MSNAQENRECHTGLALLMGLALGALCYLLAELLIPRQVASPGHHDILLANRLGFIYTPVVGIWLGWLQKSWLRALVGAMVGVIIGFAYMVLCASGNFLAIMVGFPCLLGGFLAALAGSNRSPWLIGFPHRLGKGLIAGLVLGFVYMVTLNVVGAMVMIAPSPNIATITSGYVAMMWRAGPVALGLSSGLFFVLMRWSVGLARLRLRIFGEAGDERDGYCRKCDYDLTGNVSGVCPECGEAVPGRGADKTAGVPPNGATK